MRLGIPSEELKDRISSFEFMEYVVYLDMELDNPTRDHYFMAQIAQEVHNGLKAKGRLRTLKEFMSPFQRKKVRSEGKKQQSDKEMQRILLGAFGFRPDGTKV